MNKFNVERSRCETRGCGNHIHFNNAGASLMPAPVCDALHGYTKQEEMEGGYEVMNKQAEPLENFYRAAAKLLNCGTDEIAFCDSASRAWASAFYALPLRAGDRVLVGNAEYGSNLVALLQQTKRVGIELVRVPDAESGQIDTAALETLIDNRVMLICLTHIPSGNGLVNPAAEVGRIARSHGIPYLLDACQSLGQLPVDVEEIGCDLLCGTGRKYLRGPRGTGLLYVRKQWLETLEPALLNHHAATLTGANAYQLRGDARRFEFWERNCAGQVALGVAIDYALSWGLPAVEDRVKSLAKQLRQQLRDINGIQVTDRGREQCGIVTFFAEQKPAEQLQQQLFQQRIHTSLVDFSANPFLVDQYHWPKLLRASLHYYNTLEELEYFLEVLNTALIRN